MTTLADIVAKAMVRTRKYPLALDSQDARQEAWVAGIEAQKDGISDPGEIQKRIENHLAALDKKERERRHFEIPMTAHGLQQQETVRTLRERGMSQARVEAVLRSREYSK